LKYIGDSGMTQTAIGTKGNCLECQHYNPKKMKCALDNFKISLKEAKENSCMRFEKAK
jgi:hypothetical protein